jgi:hypothetical protein
MLDHLRPMPAVCAAGYGTYLRDPSASANFSQEIPRTPPPCRVLPTELPREDALCRCMPCPQGYASRGGLLSAAACIPQLTFHVRFQLAVAATLQPCDANVTTALVKALSAAIKVYPGVINASSSVHLTGCTITRQQGRVRHAHTSACPLPSSRHVPNEVDVCCYRLNQPVTPTCCVLLRSAQVELKGFTVLT